jgi:hypothetical protein
MKDMSSQLRSYVWPASQSRHLIGIEAPIICLAAFILAKCLGKTSAASRTAVAVHVE